MENFIYTHENLMNYFISNRKILIRGEVNEALALETILTLYKLTKENNKEPIYLFIDSIGGDVQAGLTIIDAMKYIEAPVYTFCYSLAASMAAVILAAGDRRFAFEHATVMIHQPLTAMQGYQKQTDLTEQAKKIEAKRKKIETMLSEYTKGKTPFKKMHKACEYDHYLTSQEALEMGLIDEIVKGSKKII